MTLDVQCALRIGELDLDVALSAPAGTVTAVLGPNGAGKTTLLRVIAGEVGGHRGPGATHTPISVLHATVAAGAQVTVPWPAEFNALGYVLAGAGSVGMQGAPVDTGQLVVFGPGHAMTLRGGAGPLDVLLLGGTPLREPVVAHGPFVMNTRSQIIEAMEDYQAGRLGVVPEGAIQPFRMS